jgi:sec-independent protein translocase protein TatB
VARTVGHFIGKAQRYVADVKAEVNRSIELEELKKMKGEFEDAARNVERSVDGEIRQTSSHFDDLWKDPAHEATGTSSTSDKSTDTGWVPPPPEYRHPKKNWRLKRGATPQWYKQRNKVRAKAQSGAARVARFRPPQARS